MKTINYSLAFCKTECLKLIGHCDADWASKIWATDTVSQAIVFLYLNLVELLVGRQRNISQ